MSMYVCIYTYMYIYIYMCTQFFKGGGGLLLRILTLSCHKEVHNIVLSMVAELKSLAAAPVFEFVELGALFSPPSCKKQAPAVFLRALRKGSPQNP